MASGEQLPRRPGSTDVARLAGVSQKTVSRVFNGEQYVTSEVRARVQAAARSLGYRPNQAARALNTGRTHRLGVVSLGSALFGPASMLVGLERTARREGYDLSVVNTFENEPDGIREAIEILLEQGVEGVVLSEPIDNQHPIEISVDVPVLTFGRFPELAGPGVIVAGFDGVAGAHAATKHLLDLGHETVLHVAGPQRWWAAQDRIEGWRQALRDARAPESLCLEGDWSARSGYLAGQAIAQQGGATAIFAGNDDMAIGVIRALNEAGARVPEDVSVVGYDDIPSAAFLSPPLTTVAQDFERAAAEGLSRLISVITAGDAPAAAFSAEAPNLIVRDSTAPPPGSHIKGAM